MTYLLVCVFALSIMILLMPLLQRLALHIGAVDKPGGRKVHAVPIPRIGGVLITFSILLSLVVFAPLALELRALMAGMMTISALGLTDDILGVKALYKFGVQWLVAALFMAMVRPDLQVVLGLSNWFAYPMAAFFLVGLVNAVNLQDGLDGLAAGQVVISAVCMSIHLLYSGEWVLVLVLVATVSAVMGFLRVNTWPASIFMGDAGSYVLGFVLGAVFLLGLAAGALPWWSAFCYFALPILDTSQVIVGRLVTGRPVFRADRRHIHHHLLSAGFPHDQVVFVEYLVAGTLGLLPMLWMSPLRLRWLGVGLQVILLALTVSRLMKPSMAVQPSRATKRVVLGLVLAAILCILGLQVADIDQLTIKYGLLPTALALSFAAWSHLQLRKQAEQRLSMATSLLVAVQLFVFHLHSPGGLPWEWGPVRLHLLAWMTLGIVCVLLLLVWLKDREIVGSPLEVLLVFGTLSLFFLPVELKGRFRTDWLALELLAFHALQRLLHHLVGAHAMRFAPLAAAFSLCMLLLFGIVSS